MDNINYLISTWENKEPFSERRREVDCDCRSGDPDDGCACPNCMDNGYVYITQEFEMEDEDE